MILSWLIHIPLIVWLAFTLYRSTATAPLRYAYLPAILLKLGAGIVLGLIFKYYYPGGDTWTLFDSAERFTRVLYTKPSGYLELMLHNDVSYMLPVDQSLVSQPRAMFFAKIISLVNAFTYNSYWLTSLYFSLFSFAGIWLLANKLVKLFSLNTQAAAFSFFFFPSVVFWSSGILKESLTMGAISLIIFLALRLIFSSDQQEERLNHRPEKAPMPARSNLKEEVRLPDAAVIILMAFLLWKVKYYYFAVALPVIFAFIISIIAGRGTSFERKNWFRTAVFFSTLIVSLLLATLVHPNLNLSAIGQALIQNYEQTLRVSQEVDFSFPGLKNDPLVFLAYTPKALVTGLFRPFLWESDLNLQLLAALENFIILLLALVMIGYGIFTRSFTANSWTTAAATYVIVLAVLLAFASPNFGALVRYRVGFLPFLVLLLTNRNPVFCWFFRRNPAEKLRQSDFIPLNKENIG